MKLDWVIHWLSAVPALISFFYVKQDIIFWSLMVFAFMGLAVSTKLFFRRMKKEYGDVM